MKRTGFLAFGAAALLITFQACGGKFRSLGSLDSAGNAHLQAAGNGTPYTGKKDGLKVNPPSSQEIGTSTKLQVRDGVPPYKFKAVNGAATVTLDTGIVTSNVVGASVIEVSDNSGQKAQVSVIYFDPNVPQTFASCSTPWGQIVPHGVEITVYNQAAATCPASCTSQLRRCNDGQFNQPIAGTFATCSFRACEFKVSHWAYSQTCSIVEVAQVPASCQPSDLNREVCRYVPTDLLATHYRCVSPDTVVIPTDSFPPADPNYVPPINEN